MFSSVFLRAALLLSACNPAAHYESAANIGNSRVELTPQLTQAEIDGRAPVKQSGKRAAKSVTQVNASAEKIKKYKRVATLAAPQAGGKNEIVTGSVAANAGTGSDLGLELGSLRESNIKALETAFKPNGEFYRSADEIKGNGSARCRKILAQAGISSAILRSPSVSANIDDEANLGLGVSYDFVDLKRANLDEELALARCYRLAISTKLTKLLITSSQALTRTGYLAKAEYLRKSKGQFNKLRSEIKAAIEDGGLTALRGTALRQYIDQVSSAEAKARGEATRREIVDKIIKRNFSSLDTQLIAAERRIYEIESRRRTVDAFKIRGQVNYGRQADIDSGTSALPSASGTREGEFTSKIQVSVRLGSLSNRRHELEEVLWETSRSQHFEKDSGILWRTDELAKSNKRVLASMRAQRQQVVQAIAQAKQNSKTVNEEFSEEFLLPRLRARIDLISLRANLAGIDATIADTKRVDAKLRFKQ